MNDLPAQSVTRNAARCSRVLPSVFEAPGFAFTRSHAPGKAAPVDPMMPTSVLYKPWPTRSLEEIRADILVLEKETEDLLTAIVEGVAS